MKLGVRIGSKQTAQKASQNRQEQLLPREEENMRMQGGVKTRLIQISSLPRNRFCP